MLDNIPFDNLKNQHKEQRRKIEWQSNEIHLFPQKQEYAEDMRKLGIKVYNQMIADCIYLPEDRKQQVFRESFDKLTPLEQHAFYECLQSEARKTVDNADKKLSIVVKARMMSEHLANLISQNSQDPVVRSWLAREIVHQVLPPSVKREFRRAPLWQQVQGISLQSWEETLQGLGPDQTHSMDYDSRKIRDLKGIIRKYIDKIKSHAEIMDNLEQLKEINISINSLKTKNQHLLALQRSMRDWIHPFHWEKIKLPTPDEHSQQRLEDFKRKQR